MPNQHTCNACGHTDNAPELYALAGPTGGGWYCRNHNACHRRTAQHRTQPKENTMTTPQFGTYTEPTNPDSDDYKPREHYGNSAIVKVLEYKPEIVTPNSPNGAPGVIVDVHDLNVKATYRNVLMMTGAIVDGFKPHVGGNPLVIRWDKRTAGNGRTYPAPVPASDAANEAAMNLYRTIGDPFVDLPTGIIESEAPF